MQFATFSSITDETHRWGVRVGADSIVDLAAARAADSVIPASLTSLVASQGNVRAGAIAAIERAVRSGENVISLDTVRLLAPIEPVRNVFAVGVNYASHAAESEHSASAPDRPIVFSKASTSVTGPGDIRVDPALTSKVDWEVELAVVIGTGGRYISEADALASVFGYMTANDLSARDQQHGRPEGQWFIGKSLDEFCPIGPWLVAADELHDPAGLTVRLTVNGVVKQEANTSELIFPVERLVSEISQFITLLPGDIILTGTPAGVGDARSPQEYLADGDTVTAEVVGLGALVNRIVFVKRDAK